MAMTKQDKAEMTAVFDAALKNFKQIEILERELISSQLNRIEEKTIEINAKVDKTNGSVLMHTEEIYQLKKDIPHTIDMCPQKNIIQVLHDSHQRDVGVKRWVMFTISLLAGFAGALVAVMAVYELFLKHNG
jgi:hypothetical protein